MYVESRCELCCSSIIEYAPRRALRGGISKVNFEQRLSTFGNKCPQNGSKNGSMAPSTGMGCPHIGPFVVSVWRGMRARRQHSRHAPNLLNRSRWCCYRSLTRGTVTSTLHRAAHLSGCARRVAGAGCSAIRYLSLQISHEYRSLYHSLYITSKWSRPDPFVSKQWTSSWRNPIS